MKNIWKNRFAVYKAVFLWYITDQEQPFITALHFEREKMQKIISAGNLLDENGNLTECGYATEAVKIYDRKAIKAGKLRIKEWDYYFISNGKQGVCLTIDDNSYMSLSSVSFLDFEKRTYITKSTMHALSFGKIGLTPDYRTGTVCYKDKKVDGCFAQENGRRKLTFTFRQFDKKQDFTCEFELFDEPRDKIVIATPFDKPKHFYYNIKANAMTARGYCTIGKTRYVFSEENSLATLDWGRGAWTYSNEWYWGSLQCLIDDVKFGFNIGYGFGNTSAASENMLFYDGKAHKLNQVVFNIPKNSSGKGFDYMSPWTFTDDEGRFNLSFVPLIDRYDNANALIISSNQHQVFGLFSGMVTLDDGRVIEIKDKIGFAEHVRNRW